MIETIVRRKRLSEHREAQEDLAYCLSRPPAERQEVWAAMKD